MPTPVHLLIDGTDTMFSYKSNNTLKKQLKLKFMPFFQRTPITIIRKMPLPIATSPVKTRNIGYFIVVCLDHSSSVWLVCWSLKNTSRYIFSIAFWENNIILYIKVCPFGMTLRQQISDHLQHYFSYILIYISSDIYQWQIRWGKYSKKMEKMNEFHEFFWIW